MTEEERSRIISEDYADFIIDYRNNPITFEELQNATTHTINKSFAIIHIPVSEITAISLSGNRLVNIPNLLGLVSEESLDASGVSEQRYIPNLNLRGEGILIGIVDTGINYNLPVFKKADASTKIVSIWDQTIQSEDNYPFETYFGTEYNSEQINQALGEANPLEIVPSTDENGHGTMLAAIAAGTDIQEENFFGVAPDAEIVVVKLLQAKEYLKKLYIVADGAVCFQENHAMWGVEYCMQVARRLRRPIALCIGIGTSQSAHDGRSPLSEGLSMLADVPRIGVVTAVGNEGNLGRHYHAIIDPAVGSKTLELNVGENDSGFTIELWGESPGIYSIDILSPYGEYIPRITASLRVNREISFIFEETIILVEYQTVEFHTGDQLILLRFRNTSAGIWRFSVYAQGDLVTGFHLWLPMGDFISKETYFIQPDIYTTILDPATATVPIAVTAYNPNSKTLLANASRGYTRSNTIKPELAAPGVNYIAPDAKGGYTRFTGSGVAAAHTTGIVALALEWGIIRGNQPNIDTLEIKKFLIRGAQRSPNLTYPNRDWGYGIIDIFHTFDVLRTYL